MLELNDAVFVFVLKDDQSVKIAVQQMEEKQYCLDVVKLNEKNGNIVLGVALNYSTEDGVRVDFLRAQMEEGRLVLRCGAKNASRR